MEPSLSSKTKMETLKLFFSKNPPKPELEPEVPFLLWNQKPEVLDKRQELPNTGKILTMVLVWVLVHPKGIMGQHYFTPTKCTHF
jgi:hypothetical protein